MLTADPLIPSGLWATLAVIAAVILALYAWKKPFSISRARWTAIIALMGAFDEFLQSFFPYRTATVKDWGIDVCAGLFASALLWGIVLSKPDAPHPS